MALNSFKDTSSCLRLNVILPRQSSNDTSSDTNPVGGGDVGGGEADASESITPGLRPALSDHRLTGGFQQAGVRWHSYSGAIPGSLFDEEVKHSSSAVSKTTASRKTSREEGVGLLNGTEKPSKSVFILAPDGNCIFFWSWIVCAACLYNLWVIPYRFSFDEITHSTTSLWFTLDYLADSIYILDLLIGFRMAYLENGILQKDPRKARHHYLNSTCFYLNCLCILPLDLLYVSVGFISLLRILRFVKIFKLIECSDMTQRRSIHPNTFRAIGWIITALTVLHWNACFYNCAIKSLSSGKNSTKDNALETYLRSTYESLLCLVLHNQPQSDDSSHMRQHYVLLIFEGLVGITMITSLIANVNMLIANANVNDNDFRRQLAEVRMYLVRRKAPETLKRRVVCWFDYLWRQSHIPDEQRVFKHLPDRLKAEIAIHVHLDMLKRVDMFQDTEEGFLLDLVLRLRPALFSPGDFICRKVTGTVKAKICGPLAECCHLVDECPGHGWVLKMAVVIEGVEFCHIGVHKENYSVSQLQHSEIGREMFLVSQGKLDVLAADETSILATLGPGSYFGEISILNMGNVGNRRTASVRSIGYSDLFCLSKEDLWDVLSDYPSAKRKLEKVAFDRLSACRSPNQSSENCFGEMNCMEIHRRPQRSASSVSTVSRRSPFPLPLQFQIPQSPLPPFLPPPPPTNRLGLKRRRSALSSNSSFVPCGSRSSDRHTSLDHSCSTKTTPTPILHRQFSLQCNYGETLETVIQPHRRAITASVIRTSENSGEEAAPSVPFQLPVDTANNIIPQIRFERAATPVGRLETDCDLKTPPVQFSIPEEAHDDEIQNQALLQPPEVSNHLYLSSQSTSHSNSGCGSCVGSPYLQPSVQMNLLLELQRRVSTLESENRMLSMYLRQVLRQPDLSGRSSTQHG
ncbi:hypothetical protein Aperf_G00000080856 [Anoplocephala perfoliata]